MSSDINHLKQLIKSKAAKIGVIGLGYVGLPLCMSFAREDFITFGFDIDHSKIKKLNQGESYISNLNSDILSRFIAKKRFSPTADFSQINNIDVIIICVPTPLNELQEPNLQYITSTANLILPYLKKNQLIVLESTTYPGTTSEILKPIIEKDQFRSEKNIFLAYSPEREDPGNVKFNNNNTPKIVGGDGPIASDLACTIYDQVFIETISVSSMEIAEAVKLTENIFRSVNIAMINELKLIYSKMDIDIWEVIEAAKTKPFGYMPFYPGPGLGGHCIPIDPFYLSYRAKKYGKTAEFINLAGKINSEMPKNVMETLKTALKQSLQKDLNGSKILIVGIAYKKNINDTRESPGLTLLELIEESGAKASYFDPFVPSIPVTRKHPKLADIKSVKWSIKEISGYDAALICTDHDNINYEHLLEHSKLIVDTRNALGIIGADSGKVVKA